MLHELEEDIVEEVGEIMVAGVVEGEMRQGSSGTKEGKGREFVVGNVMVGGTTSTLRTKVFKETGFDRCGGERTGYQGPPENIICQ